MSHYPGRIKDSPDSNGRTYFGRPRGDSKDYNVGKQGQLAHGFGTVVITTSPIVAIISSREPKDRDCRITEKAIGLQLTEQWGEHMTLALLVGVPDVGFKLLKII